MYIAHFSFNDLIEEMHYGDMASVIDDILTLKVLNFWKLTSYWSLKPLWSGMGEVVPARTSPTLHPPSPPTVHQMSRLATVGVKSYWMTFWASAYCTHLCFCLIRLDMHISVLSLFQDPWE